MDLEEQIENIQHKNELTESPNLKEILCLQGTGLAQKING